MERTPSGVWLGVPELEAHIRQTHQGRVSGDIGPIAQHGINNLVGGWGCRGSPNSVSVNGSVVMLHYRGQRLTHTLV